MKHHLTASASKRLLASVTLLLTALLLAASCSPADEPITIGLPTTTVADSEVAPTADASATETGANGSVGDDEAVPAASPVDRIAASAEVMAAGVVLDVHDMAVEPSGVQMRVEQIVQRSDATFVRLAIVNGSEEDREVPHHQVARLTLPDGTTHEPIAAFPTLAERLDMGEASVVVLVYPPTSGPFDLEVGVDGLLDSPFSPLVDFRFENLDPARLLPGLQPDAPLAAVGTHPNGTQIELDGIRFTPDRIGVQIDVRNGSETELWLFGAHDTYLEDDLGNLYRAFVKPNGTSFFELDPESSLTGVLTFVGRMDPRATSFSIIVNQGGLLTNSLAKSPAFVLGPFDVGTAQTVDVPVDVDVDESISHANGLTATLSAFTFDERAIRAQLSIINEGGEQVDFNEGLTYVVDSEGITYQSQLEELSELILSPGEGFEGEIVFSGRLQPAASSLRLTVNHGAQIWHSFFFDAVDVERATSAAVLSSFEVDDISTFEIGSLDTSSVAEIAVAIAEFDGIEVEGGVLLTLPETILFDFGQSTLRPEAATSIALVSDILEYYEGDQVLVVGHTDSIGDDASNLALSVDRATAVLEGLVAAGVDPNLLAIDGRGESEPVAANQQPDGSDDPEGRQLNRRVEIFIETSRGLPTID